MGWCCLNWNSTCSVGIKGNAENVPRRGGRVRGVRSIAALRGSRCGPEDDIRKLQPPAEILVRAALAAALRRSGELRFVHRLHGVLLVSLGRSCYEVAQWFEEDPRTVERWVHAFRVAGADGLLDHHHGGRPGPLTLPQQQQLAQDLATDPGHAGYAQLRWSGKLLALHLERNYGVCLSVRQCQRMLGR